MLKKEGDAASFLALANDTPYPIQLETIVRCPEGTGLTDLAWTAPLNGEPIAGGLRVIADLPPFGVASVRIDAPAAAVESISPHPSAAVLDGMKAQYDDLSVTLARLKRLAGGTSSAGPANADFEAPALTLVSGRGKAGVSGWQAVGHEAAAISIDPENAHAGRASLRLDAEGGPASVASDPFAPSGRPSLTIQAWFRSERPDARVRLWIEGTAAGRPYARQLEFPARPEWTATGPIRASGIPDAGLESARLRFELLTPGRLWLDDVTVSGPALSESERFLASRDLMAALSAYRDHRYADFARLAGSHWTRHVAEPGSNRLAGERAIPIRTGDASSSALPTSRRLR
jgi:hypothetical protein